LKACDIKVGSVIKTPKGSEVTVVRVEKGSSTVYTRCSVCSEDTELFPELIKSYKYSLSKGGVSCGCSKNTKWDQRQYRIKVDRQTILKGYKVVGLMGHHVTENTKIKLECLHDGNIWSPRVGAVLSGVGCKKCAIADSKRVLTISDNEYSKGFMGTGKFLEGCTFERNTTRVDHKGANSYMDMFCPVCSVDIYVENGLCSGVFTGLISSYKKGVTPCRCSKSYRWNSAQREYQLTKELCKRGHTFLGFNKEGYIGSQSKPFWICSNGHIINNTSVVNILNKGIDCKFCSQRGAQRVPAGVVVEKAISNGWLPKGSYLISEFDKGYVRYLKYFCGRCAVDEFTQNGVCDGVFCTSVTALNTGTLPCRCSLAPKYTKDQMLFRVSTKLKILGVTLVGIQEGVLYKDTDVYVECGNKTWTINLNTLMCNGYTKNYFTGKCSVYVVLWEMDGMFLLKVGLTQTTLQYRVYSQALVTNFTPLNGYLFEDVAHSTGRSVELALKSLYGGRYVKKVEFVDGYTETYCPVLLEDILIYIRKETGTYYTKIEDTVTTLM